MIRSLEVVVMPIVAGLFLAIVAAPANAQDLEEYRLLGNWAGYGQSITQDPVFDVSFDIDIQNGRHFSGFLNKAMIPFDGTVANSGVINAAGIGPGGGSIVLHGFTRVPGGGSVRLAALRYMVEDAAGQVVDLGYALFVQRIGGLKWAAPGPVQIFGNWSGDWVSDTRKGMTGAANSMIDWQTGSGISGIGSFFDIFPEVDLDWRAQGTVGAPGDQDSGNGVPAVQIGANKQGTIAILIGLLLPAVQPEPGKLVGEYHLFNSFFDVFLEFKNPKKGTAFERGLFSLVETQPK